MISDNCRGMGHEKLKRLVLNVGQSTKRGQADVNGRFGFGIHAFRAASNKLTVVSKALDPELQKSESCHVTIDKRDSQIALPEPLSSIKDKSKKEAFDDLVPFDSGKMFSSIFNVFAN